MSIKLKSAVACLRNTLSLRLSPTGQSATSSKGITYTTTIAIYHSGLAKLVCRGPGLPAEIT